MRTIFALLKLQLDNKTDLLKMTSPKKMLSALFRAILLLVLATLGLSLALSQVLNFGFRINEEFMTLVLLLTQAITLVFAIGTMINTLYLSSDNALLICLPATPNQLFISKLLLIYISEFAVNAAITLPLLITLGRATEVGASFYLSIPLLLLLLPILPLVLAAFLSIPLMALISFLKKHPLLATLSVFALVAVCLWGYLSLIRTFATEFNIAEKQLETAMKVNAFVGSIGSRIPIYYQLATAMYDFSRWFFYPLLLLLCVAISSLTVIFTRYFFFKIAMSSLEKTVHAKRREGRFRRRGIFRSLFHKEVLCVFRSTTDVFEYFLFTGLMPFIVFSYDRLLMNINVNRDGINMVAGAHVMVVAILAMLSNISSASAISRDGGNFHTSKIIPVNYYTQIFAKFAFNAVFTLLALVVTGCISAFMYPLWQVLLSTAAVAMAAIGHIAFCIESDIKSPTVNMEGNEKASTVSKSTPKSLIVGLLIGFALGLIVIMMATVKNALLPYLIIIGLSFVFMIYRVYFLILRINLTYDKIEM